MGAHERSDEEMLAGLDFALSCEAPVLWPRGGRACDGEAFGAIRCMRCRSLRMVCRTCWVGWNAAVRAATSAACTKCLFADKPAKVFELVRF